MILCFEQYLLLTEQSPLQMQIRTPYTSIECTSIILWLFATLIILTLLLYPQPELLSMENITALDSAQSSTISDEGIAIPTSMFFFKFY